jgi:antitoxin component of MazEF toxin-antitoxin module
MKRPRKPERTTAPKGERSKLLERLIARITKNNRHGETDWGSPVGKEEW